MIWTTKNLELKWKTWKEQYKLEKKRILTEYVMSWCPYKVGDLVRDHIGYVKILSIHPIIGICNKVDIMMKGVEYTVNKEPKKNGATRQIYHSNIEQYENSTKKENSK